MAFVSHYGKGRTFHCVLGHDAKALSVPGGAGTVPARLRLGGGAGAGGGTDGATRDRSEI